MTLRRRSLVAAARTLTLCTPWLVAAQSAVPRLTLVQEVKIDGAAEDISGMSTPVSIGDGWSAIFDSPTARFVFFDRAGKRVGTFGAKGAGPGEFSPMGGIASMQNMFSLRTGMIGDTMWVFNSTDRRYTLIGGDLKLIRSGVATQPNTATIPRFSYMGMLDRGRWIGTATFGKTEEVATAAGGTARTFSATDSAVIVMAADGTVERRLAQSPPMTAMAVHNPPGGRYQFAPVPFGHLPFVYASPMGDRVGVAWSTISSETGGTFHVTVVRVTGDTVFSRQFPFTSEPVTKRMADSAYDRMATVYRGPERAELMKIVRERIPAVRAPFEAFKFGSDGSIWLTRERPSSQPGEVLVLAPNGALRGSLVMPRAGLYVVHASATHVWATERDGDGFVSLVRFRVDSRQ